jgi:hypothetical protein
MSKVSIGIRLTFLIFCHYILRDVPNGSARLQVTVLNLCVVINLQFNSCALVLYTFDDI